MRTEGGFDVLHAKPEAKVVTIISYCRATAAVLAARSNSISGPALRRNPTSHEGFDAIG